MLPKGHIPVVTLPTRPAWQPYQHGGYISGIIGCHGTNLGRKKDYDAENIG